MFLQRAHGGAGAPDDQSRGRMAPGERGVSPVIGVALMIAVTVTLAVIVVPVVFAISGDAGDPVPNTDFGFSYDEGVEPTRTDSFGNTSVDVQGAGLMTIVVESGDGIEADNLEIRGGASGGTLSTASRYGPEDTLIPGEEITVWVNRGDDIQLIWNDPEAGESEVLAEFAVRPTTDLPVFVPDPDQGCDWVESRVPGDLTVDGIVVNCDLSAYSVDDVDVVNGGAIIGDVPAGGDVNLDGGTVYLGDVNATGDLTMDNGAEIDGDVVVGGASSPALSVQNSRIRGNVDVGGDVSLSGATVDGELDAAGDLALDDAVIEGPASATGDVTLTTQSSVLGDASSAQTISLDDQSEITGDAVLPDVGTDLSCNDGDSSLVDGVGCKEYKAPAYAVTIDGTNAPVEGNNLDVNVTVENTGYESGSPTVDLTVDGVTRDSVSLSIAGQSSTQTTLTWSTSSGDNGTHDAVVDVFDGSGDHEDSDTESVLIADDSRSQDGLIFEINDNGSATEIQVGDTVGYTGTATFDDGSTEDVTDALNVTVLSGNASDVTIDESAAAITGDDSGTVTIEGNDSSFADTVDLTVKPPMADRTVVASATLGSPTVQFTLENTGSDPVEITDISVDSVTSSGNVDKVDNDGNNEVIEVSDAGYLDTQRIDIGGSARSFDAVPTIAGGDTSAFELAEIRQKNGKTRAATEVMFTLYFSDGTSRHYTIN